MQFKVECYENTSMFNPEVPERPFIVHKEDVPWVLAQPMRLVVTLTVEAENSNEAADVAFEIGNAPWEPADVNGVVWPHRAARSMSSGDVVVVHTPDGMVANVCLFAGWARSTAYPLAISA